MKCLAGIFGIAALLAGCGSKRSIDLRYVAVHNVLESIGMSPSGPISEGSLSQGNSVRFPIDLDAGACSTFVAFASDGADDLDLVLLDTTGNEVARDATHGLQAVVTFCATEPGRYSLVLSFAEGSGSYRLSRFSGGQSPTVGMAQAGGEGRSRGGPGTCAQPLSLDVGRVVHGSTARAASQLSGSCTRGNAPEVVYRIDVATRSQVNLNVDASFDAAVYVLSDCGEQRTEVGCNDDDGSASRSALHLVLDPGTYFVVIDAFQDQSGDFDLISSVAEVEPLANICNAAPQLISGQPMSGSTVGAVDYFHATCAGGTASPDRVYRLEIAQRSRVRIAQESDHDGALHLRRSCEDSTTELACNDDTPDERHSLITALLDPGTYYVISDGYGGSASGSFTLHPEVQPEAGASATGDACTDAIAVTLDQPVQLDTISARDDFSASCGGQGAPDVVYSVTVRSRSRLVATVRQPQFAGALSIRRGCTSDSLACEPIRQAGQTPSSVSADVQPGTYFIVVDGAAPESFGTGELLVTLQDAARLSAECQNAPLLRPGQSVTGSTATGADRYHGSCADRTASNDVVYRLRLTRRQRVRLDLEAQYDGALYLRRTCADESSEVACNDDHEDDNRRSHLDEVLDAGTYFVIVDGFGANSNGDFTLRTEVSNP